MKILDILNVNTSNNGLSLEKYLNKIHDSQNLNSSACIKAIGAFLRNKKKEIIEDDLKNPVRVF